MHIVAAITYVDEITLDLSIGSILGQCIKIPLLTVINNVCPMHKAFNKAMDLACGSGADLLLLLAADTILKPRAVREMLNFFCIANDFILTGLSEDVIFDPGPGGFFIYNMKLLGNKFRYGNSPLEDRDWVRKVRKDTGWKHKKLKHKRFSVHHPIWTPKDIFMKLRFCLPRFKDNARLINQYRTFLNEGVKLFPSNKVFIVGRDLFEIMIRKLDKYILMDKDYKKLDWQWTKFSRSYNLSGNEYFAMPEYDWFAKRRLVEKERI